MPAVIPWDYEEISRSENMDRSSFDAQRVLKCAWENRLKLAQALLGGTVDTVAYSRGTYDDWPAAVVTKVGSIQPFQANPQDKNGDGLAATFDHAQLTVQYSTIFSPNGEQQVSNADGTRSEGLRGAKEFLTLPAKQLYWANNQTQPLPDEHQPGLLVSMIEWSVTLARQTSIHTDHLTASGKINNAAVVSTILGLTFASDTLLYEDPELSQSNDDEGNIAFDLTKTFKYRPNGWNKFFNPQTGSWATVYDESGNAFEPFTATSFANIA